MVNRDAELRVITMDRDSDIRSSITESLLGRLNIDSDVSVEYNHLRGMFEVNITFAPFHLEKLDQIKSVIRLTLAHLDIRETKVTDEGQFNLAG